MLERLGRSAVVQVLRRYSADEGGHLAVLIAWTGLLSVFPLVLALHALVGLVVRDPQAWAGVEEAVARSFPAEAAELVQQELLNARQGSAERGVLGLAGLLVSGSALFGSMAHAFNHVYRVKNRGMLGQRLMALAMVVVFSVLVVVSLLASAGANLALAMVQGTLPAAVPGAGLLVSAAAWGVSLLTAFVLFLAIYRVVPNAGQGLREVWPGALLGALGFFLLGQLFPLYVRFFGGFGQYAMFGLFFLVMTWSWLLAQLLVVGAELNAQLFRPPPRAAPGAAGGGHHGKVARLGPAHRQGIVKRALDAALAGPASWAVLRAARAAVAGRRE